MRVQAEQWQLPHVHRIVEGVEGELVVAAAAAEEVVW
jgi:hypothetical protein